MLFYRIIFLVGLQRAYFIIESTFHAFLFDPFIDKEYNVNKGNLFYEY